MGIDWLLVIDERRLDTPILINPDTHRHFTCLVYLVGGMAMFVYGLFFRWVTGFAIELLLVCTWRVVTIVVQEKSICKTTQRMQITN